MTLIERLETAEQGSRELDALVCAAAQYPPSEHWSYRVEASGVSIRLIGTGREVRITPPAITTVLSAAVALVERVLPGWCYRFGTCHVSDDAWLCPDWNDPKHGARLRAELGEPVHGEWSDVGIDVDLRPSGRLPIAICIALLKALEAKEGGE